MTFQSFEFECKQKAYMMNVIPETRRV